MADHPSDRAIITESLSHPAAFAAIFDRHYPAIYRYLARRLGRDAASDVASETFSIAFDNRRRFDGRCPTAAPWLFGIATNLARRHARAERRQLHAYGRAGSPEFDLGDGAEAIDRADAHRLGCEVALALAKLPQQGREVLLLYAWAELDYEAIAVVLGVPVGTVRSRLSRARNQMRRHLAPTEPAGRFTNELAQERR